MMRKQTRGVAIALAATVLGTGACGPGSVPAGQPPIVALTEQYLQTVRHQFNQAVDQTRVVLLLSPT